MTDDGDNICCGVSQVTRAGILVVRLVEMLVLESST